jgi:basic membrane protein A
MLKKYYAICSSLLLIAILCTGCTKSTPEPTAAPTSVPTEAPMLGAGMTICQVTDLNGMQDESLNALVWAGVEKAESQLGITGRYLESQIEADYEVNINTFLEENCDLIIASGYSLNEAVKAAAESNPDQWFYMVDVESDLSLSNVKGQVFNVEEAAFLAGYAAAGVTETAKVGTFGSTQTPTVTAFMDGFYMGVQYYNQEHETNIEVLGWDPIEKTGIFMEGMPNAEDARANAEALVDQGADIVMPVVGAAGLGAVDLALEFRDIYIVGVTTDWGRISPEYVDAMLTSVLKNADDTTLDVIQSVVDGSLSSGIVAGTLNNGGVSLAPVTVRAVAMSADVTSWFDTLKVEIKEVEDSIKAGEVQTSP